jgi:HD-GYP domain-containing protein (c-di-GMP phosphodiesterase class II)
MLLNKLHSLTSLPAFDNEEDRRVARILSTTVYALVAACPAFMVVSLALREWLPAACLVGLAISLFVVLALLRRRQVAAGSLLTTLAVLAVVTVIVTDGQGIHDVTIVIYPAIITLASLLLRRRLFTILSLLTMASVGWTVFGPMAGWFKPKPYLPGRASDFVIVSLVLGLTALLVYYLADHMRQSLAQARREIADRREAEEQLKDRLAELEAMARVSVALRKARGLNEMLPLVLDEILASLGADAGSLAMVDAAGEGEKAMVARGWFAPAGRAALRAGRDVASQVLVNGQLYRTLEFQSDPHTASMARASIPPGWGGDCVAIRAGQEIVGALCVALPAPRELSESQARLLMTLAEIGGNAIHRVQLHETTERNLQRLAALRTIDQAITANHDPKESLNTLLEQVIVQLGADAAAVLTLSANKLALDYTAGQGFRTPLVTESSPYPGMGYAGRAIQERRQLGFSDLNQTAAPATGRMLLANAEGFRAYHAVPLLAKGEVKGVLEVFHRHPFEPSPDWLNFLDALAGQAAIAMDNSALFDSLEHSNAELTKAYDATIEGWARALDLRERDTGDHARRVAALAVELAELAGVTGEDLVHFRRGALLHDIGKVGIPDPILLKPGPLSEDEWAIMRRHPIYAYELLAPIAYLHPALDIPYCHHEKWDGTGYPNRLQGLAIPLAARLFAVVDVWDALRSDRPYRLAWPEARVLAHLHEQAGTHFDPQVVALFERLISAR